MPDEIALNEDEWAALDPSWAQSKPRGEAESEDNRSSLPAPEPDAPDLFDELDV